MEIREFLFSPLKGKTYLFSIKARESGIFSGSDCLRSIAAELHLDPCLVQGEGQRLSEGSLVFSAAGDAETVTKAEEMLPGAIGKPSGVATAAASFVERTPTIKVVCGAWKKVNQAVRSELRQAVITGGAGLRMTEEPFIYLDKNYIKMFGGIASAVGRAKGFEPGRLVVAQLRGEDADIAVEANSAVRAGADILMVDTGCVSDFQLVAGAAEQGGWRQRVRLAFAGGVSVRQLDEMADLGADIVDVGRAILDAPMLDFSLDVEGEL